MLSSFSVIRKIALFTSLYQVDDHAASSRGSCLKPTHHFFKNKEFSGMPMVPYRMDYQR